MKYTIELNPNVVSTVWTRGGGFVTSVPIGVLDVDGVDFPVTVEVIERRKFGRPVRA